MLAAETKAVGLSVVATPPLESPPSWKRIVEPVEPFLRAVAERLAEQVEDFEPEIAAYARYALTSQGKQLRPALVALSAESTGGLNDNLVTAATIIEMVHLATLVHDDVMDEAQIRRRRPTLAAHSGNTISVLVGDCLFAHALKLAAGFPTPDVCRAVATATKTVCSGEILQNQRQRQFHITRAEYFRVLRMKTAELFALSCDLGAWLSGTTGTERAVLREYGMALGTAYQIYDDCMDLFGSEAIAGKSLGTDVAGGKLTLPLIATMERGTLSDRKSLETMLLRWDQRMLPHLLALLERYETLEESRGVIRGFCASARQSLAVLPSTEGREALAEIAGFLAQQTDALGVGS
jgi:octaprenyl-diphosphate synthase